MDTYENSGTNDNSYIAVMHLSQLAGFVSAGLGFIIPVLMWVFKNDNKNIDKHGKNILNFMISMLIYMVACIPFCFILIGFVFLGILALIELIFIIMATVKAANNEFWRYPMSINFFHINND